MAATNHPRFTTYRRQGLAAFAVLLVVLLAGVNWMLSPEHARRWLLTILTLPALWLGLTLWYVSIRRSTRASGTDDGAAVERYFLSALTLMVIAVGIPQIAAFSLEIWVRFAGDRADLDVYRRVLGLTTGAVFVVVGNALPKILTPLSILPVHLAERQTSARRFVGMIFVMLGLALMAAFLVLPIGAARVLAVGATMGIVVTILGAIVWMNAGPTMGRP